MIAARAPMNTRIASPAPSGPVEAQSLSSRGITVSASSAPKCSNREIAAMPISVTTSVVARGMKVMIENERRRAMPLRAA
jgi:hypothetical protein